MSSNNEILIRKRKKDKDGSDKGFILTDHDVEQPDDSGRVISYAKDLETAIEQAGHYRAENGVEYGIRILK